VLLVYCQTVIHLASHFINKYSYHIVVYWCKQIMNARKNMVRVISSMCGYLLQTHAVQHTGEKPYKCPHCPRTFASSGNYHKHKKRMHISEKLYNLTWVVSFRRKSRHALYSSLRLVPVYRNAWKAASANMNVQIKYFMYFSECEYFVIVTKTAIFVLRH
jgi:uncharacterized C2H2 Zn-finger protein